jgi:hypothetical protein
VKSKTKGGDKFGKNRHVEPVAEGLAAAIATIARLCAMKPKSPFEAAVPANWSRETSQKAMYVRVWAPNPQPAPW